VSPQTIGIVAHSAEGASLCFLTACREGAVHMGEHMHPPIVMSAVPMALSMPGWRSGDHDTVAQHLAAGVEMVARAGASFFVCPDNTAHIVLEQIIDRLPLPGLHIAEVVRAEIIKHGFRRVGLLGTDWTMTGPVYPKALTASGIEVMVPSVATRATLDGLIFNELCNGIFTDACTQAFVQAIDDLKSRGAESVILGCTEIPLVITAENSPLPILDSTRLLAKQAVAVALASPASANGWLAQ
jgi:aspartate racemase